MKKLFFFAVACATAISINATVYEMGGITASNITVDNNGTIGTYTMDGVEIPSVSYNGAESAVMSVTLSNKIELQYKNSASKNNILKFAEKYTQADGKNVVVIIKGLNIGDQVVLTCTAKGSTAPQLQATTGAAESDVITITTESSAALEEYQKVTFTAIASEMQIKEIAGGYRIANIAVGNETALENVQAEAVKAQKVIENGQLYIIKNGVKYNALGVQVAE